MADQPSLDLLDRALDQTGRLIAAIRPEQSTLPTPCSGWDVHALVNHTVYDLRIFSAMLRGEQREAAGPDLIGDDWRTAYRTAADGLRATWQARGGEGTLKLAIGEFPATWAIGQHLADIAVHGWDVARATSQPTNFDDAVGRAALAWGRENLKPQFRGQAFGPEVPVPADAPVYDRLAGFFGRDPS